MSSSRIQSIKRALRSRIRGQRNRLAPAWVARQSALLCNPLCELPELRGAGTVLAYLALPGEVDLQRVIEALHGSGRRVVVPARSGASGAYRPCECQPGEELVRGPFGVAQPRQLRWVGLDAVDVALVPGLAFDPYGGRLGHGGGHYDRMLPDVPADCTLVGVGFDFQFITCIPQQSHDIGMHAVVTERGTVRCAHRQSL